MVVVLEDGEFLLLPSHLLTQPGIQLLSPMHPAPEREHFLVDLRPGLPLRLQGLQGTLERWLGLHLGLLEHRLGLRLVDFRRVKSPLSGGRPLHREQFHARTSVALASWSWDSRWVDSN